LTFLTFYAKKFQWKISQKEFRNCINDLFFNHYHKLHLEFHFLLNCYFHLDNYLFFHFNKLIILLYSSQRKDNYLNGEGNMKNLSWLKNKWSHAVTKLIFASLSIENFWYKQLKMLSFNANQVSFRKNQWHKERHSILNKLRI